MDTLRDLFEHLSGARPIPPQPPAAPAPVPVEVLTDFQEIKSQEHVKRALEVDAAGAHNVLHYGRHYTSFIIKINQDGFLLQNNKHHAMLISR